MGEDGIDKLARKLAETLPQSLRSARDDIEKNFRSVLQAGLDRLDLVTREEFEVQEAVLKRTREKLEVLDERLKKIESAKAAKKAGKKKPGTREAKKKKSKKSARKKPAR